MKDFLKIQFRNSDILLKELKEISKRYEVESFSISQIPIVNNYGITIELGQCIVLYKTNYDPTKKKIGDTLFNIEF